jgi:transcriptional regulator with XRE-family HTH domain
MPPVELEVVLGRNIRARRLQAGLSQIELSDRANVSVGALQHLERGEGATTRTLTRVVHALGVDSWLEQLAPLAPTFNPLDLLEARTREARTTTAPRVRRRSEGPR